MLLEEFDRLCTSRNVLTVENGYYGVYNDYPFSVTINRRGAGVLAFSFQLSDCLDKTRIKSLRSELPKGYTVTPMAEGLYQLMVIGSKCRRSEVPLTQVLDILTRSFRAGGLLPPDLCPICKQAGCDAYANLSSYRAVHRSCVDTMAVNTVGKAAADLRSGSYITGFIGALLGGLVACIPTIAVYFAGRMIGYLYALIPMGAYFGYKLFKGRMNNGAFISTILSSLVHLFSMQLISIYISILKETGLWLRFDVVARLYFTRLTPGEILESMYMSAIFMALGLWISWSYIRRNAHTDMRTMGAVHSTLTDKPNMVAAPAVAGYTPGALDQAPPLKP